MKDNPSAKPARRHEIWVLGGAVIVLAAAVIWLAVIVTRQDEAIVSLKAEKGGRKMSAITSLHFRKQMYGNLAKSLKPEEQTKGVTPEVMLAFARRLLLDDAEEQVRAENLSQEQFDSLSAELHEQGDVAEGGVRGRILN